MCHTGLLTVINLNRLFFFSFIPEVQLCGQWLTHDRIICYSTTYLQNGGEGGIISIIYSMSREAFLCMGTFFPVLRGLQDASRKFTTVENEESLN